MEPPIEIKNYRPTAAEMISVTALEDILRLGLVLLTISMLLILMDNGTSHLVAMTSLILIPLALIARVKLILPDKYNSPKNSVLLLPRSIRLDKVGYHVEVDGGVKSEFPWSMISRATLKRNSIVLFLGPQFFLVPRQLMSREDDARLLLFLVEKGLMPPDPRP